MALVRQHVIDPVICIRCNTCEETCRVDAITHNEVNYVVDPGICLQNQCLQCIGPCPTGAIDSWVTTSRPYSVEEQMEWEELPPDEEGDGEGAAPGEAARSGEGSGAPPPDEVTELLRIAGSGHGGRALPPYSAAHPYVNVYPAIARVTGNLKLTDPDAGSDIRHIVLDMGKQVFPVIEGQSIGITPPGTDERGRPHHMRLYTVASPRDGERPRHNNLSLTVKRVVYEEDGEPRPGVTSNYLCDLEIGDEVEVTGPYGTTFLMPNHPEANIVMICTGTGSAPMRAMTERRRRTAPDAPGKLMLFFGARTPGELPYFGPLMKLPKDFIDVELAFSRLPDRPRQYVQDRMRARAQDLGTLLESDETYIYICGLKGMEPGCEEVLDGICRARGLDWGTLRARMLGEGRYHVETY